MVDLKHRGENLVNGSSTVFCTMTLSTVNNLSGEG
jgi:hypothetical protein